MLELTDTVSIKVIMVNMPAKYIPVRRWEGAPGVSDNPTRRAPNETNVPFMNWPIAANIITGIIHPMVILMPSAKYWL
ncbi:hypothetical protein D3C71_1675830 [compost metagenome]